MHEVKHAWGREIRSRDFRRLYELKQIYEGSGVATRLNLHDPCNEMWSLMLHENLERGVSQNMGRRYNP